MSRLIRILFFAVLAASAAPTVHAASDSTLDSAMDALYDSVVVKFGQNQWFQPHYQPPERDLFKSALKSYCVLLESAMGKKVKNRSHYGIVNYSQHSAIPRLYIYDLPTQEIIHNIWTTHGGQSRIGAWYSLKDVDEEIFAGRTKEVAVSYNENPYASLFSNRSGSNQSSVGMTITDSETYFSQEKQWTAMRLNGIDGELNSKVRSRAVVLHEWGFNSDTIKNNRSAPLSEGCPMLPTRGTYQGQGNVEIAKLLMGELAGAPILFYHDRLDPKENELAYQEQLVTFKDMKNQLSENMSSFAEKYSWSEEAARKYESVISQKLDVWTPLIEETYRYFKNRSLYYGVEPKNEAACRRTLGI